MKLAQLFSLPPKNDIALDLSGLSAIEHPIAYVKERMASATIASHSPFPHVVIDNVFPKSYYDTLLCALPNSLKQMDSGSCAAICDLEEGWSPSFDNLPIALKTFWLDFDATISQNIILPRLTELFAPMVTDKLDALFGTLWRQHVSVQEVQELTRVQSRHTKGVIQYRKKGALQKPHMDNASSLYTSLLYLAPDARHGNSGISFYQSDEQVAINEATLQNKNIRAWYPDPTQYKIHKQQSYSYIPNRLIAFLNTPYSLHGIEPIASKVQRYSIQTQCFLPRQICAKLFAGWKDPHGPDGKYSIDLPR